MANLDPNFIKQLLEMTIEEQIEYLKSLSDEDRKLVNQALWEVNRQKLTQELIHNLNQNSRES
jgi:ABC-type cobalamin/Fe3+-siderophores transport system ATPase subunit